MRLEPNEAVKYWTERRRYLAERVDAGHREFLGALTRAETGLRKAQGRVDRARAIVAKHRARVIARAPERSTCLPGGTPDYERAMGPIEVAADGQWMCADLRVERMQGRGVGRTNWYVVDRSGRIIVRPDVRPYGGLRRGWTRQYEAREALAMLRRYAPEWWTPEGRAEALAQRYVVGTTRCETLHLVWPRAVELPREPQLWE